MTESHHDGADPEEPDFFLPEGRTYRVAGMTSLCFTAESRQEFEEEDDVPVPEPTVYVANTSVDKDFRQ